MIEHRGKHTSEGPCTHVLLAVRWSLDGLRTAWAEEIAFRLILLESACSCVLVLLLARTWLHAVLLLFPSVVCVLVELLNSAIERTVDRISPEWHILAKNAKDMGSAAQFCAQLFLFVVWLSYLVFG